MAIPTDRNAREYNKFVETDSGDTAVRVVGSSGSTSLDVSTNSVDVGGYIGKPTGQNGDFVTAYASATTITLSSLPSDVTAFYAEDIVTVEQYATDGSLTRKWTRDDSAMSIAANVLTVDDASFTNTDTFTIYTSVPRPSGGGGTSPDAEFTSPKDFTATYTSSTTITLSDLDMTIEDSSQIAYVTVIPSSGNAETYTQGSNGVTLTVSSNVITITGAGTPFASGDVYQVGLNGQKKAFDPSTNSLMNNNLNPVYSRYTDAESLISSAQDVSQAFADVGAEVDASGRKNVKFWVTQDINGGTDLRYKILGKHESGGTEEYSLSSDFVKITAPNTWEGGTGSAFFEMDNDEDDLFVISVDVENSVPYLQLQVGAGSANTGSGTAQIDAAYLTKGY